MKTKNFKRGLILSYWGMVVIPILLSGFFCYRTVAELHRNVLREQRDEIVKMQYQLDAFFSDKLLLMGQMAGDTKITKLLKIQSEEVYSPEELLLVVELQERMRSILSAEINEIDSIGLWDLENDLIISTDNLYRDVRKTQFLQSLGIYEMDLQAFAENRKQIFLYIPEEEQYPLLLCRKIYTTTFSQPTGYFFISVPRDSIRDMLELYTGQNSVIAFLHLPEGSLLASKKMENSFFEAVVNCEKEKVSVNGQKWLTARSGSSCLQVNYYLAERVSTAYRGIYNVVGLFALCLFLALVISMMLVKYFGMRSINPFYAMLDILFPKEKEKDKISIETMLQETAQMKKSTHKLERVWQNNFVAALLCGNAIQQDLFDDYLRKNQKSKPERVCVVGIRLFDVSENAVLELFSIGNVFYEILEEVVVGQPVRIDNNVYLILDIGAVDDKKGIEKELEEGILFLKEFFDLVIAVVVSNEYKQIEDTPQGRREVDALLEYAGIAGDYGRILFCENIDESIEQMDDRGYLQESRKFTNCILTGNYDEAREEYQHIWGKYIKKNYKSVKEDLIKLRHLLYILAVPLQKIEGKEFGSISYEKDTSLLSLYQKGNEMLEWLLEKETGEKVDNRIVEIEKYIEENAFDQNLSIGCVCAHFKISQSNLSRIFKKYGQEGALDYLHRVRLEEAKKLLAQGNSVSKVAEQVGYLEPKALTRVFKRYEGVTPGKYRDLCSGNQE